jgi:hypothetical protein
LEQWLVSIIVSAIISVAPTIAAIAAWRAANKTHTLVNSRMDKYLLSVASEATAVEKNRAREESEESK